MRHGTEGIRHGTEQDGTAASRCRHKMVQHGTARNGTDRIGHGTERNRSGTERNDTARHGTARSHPVKSIESIKNIYIYIYICIYI